jgi:hypothetical protein
VKHFQHQHTAIGWAAAAVFTLGCMTGCGPDDGSLPTRPVSGKVTLDGKPVGGAEIWLVPADSNATVKNAKLTIRPYAKTKADGTFVITSYYVDDGAPLGDYTIMVIVEGAADSEEARENDTPTERKGKGKRGISFPAKYRNPATSGLTVTVKDGPNTLDLELKSK